MIWERYPANRRCSCFVFLIISLLPLLVDSCSSVIVYKGTFVYVYILHKRRYNRVINHRPSSFKLAGLGKGVELVVLQMRLPRSVVA